MRDDEKLSFKEKIALAFIDGGFGLGKQEHRIVIHLSKGLYENKGEPQPKFISQLMRELNGKYPEYKWNQGSLRGLIRNLEDMGILETFEEDFKKYVKLTKSTGVWYLKIIKKWENEVKGRENENSDFNGSNSL